ncbi:MAG: lipocalin family protein [Eubacterium sp.]|nr:lipocalin family protein [Eubacterium sp.]
MKIKKLTKGQLIVVIIVAVLLLITIPAGIYCGVNNESPADLINDIVTPDDEQIIAKWQGDKAVSAYEFKDDGSYDSYISTFSIEGIYTINGNKLTLKNQSSGGEVVYKFTIRGNTLTLTLLEENGKKVDEKEETVYKKVDHFNMKSLTDILSDYAEELNEEETTEKE